MLHNLNSILPGLTLNFKLQRKTTDCFSPGFSPFFFVFLTQSCLLLLFHDTDGDEETVQFEKEVCTIQKLLLCTLSYITDSQMEESPGSSSFGRHSAMKDTATEAVNPPVRKRAKTAPIWQHFTKQDSGYKCNYCRPLNSLGD